MQWQGINFKEQNVLVYNHANAMITQIILIPSLDQPLYGNLIRQDLT